ncbi:ClbS/DfsB family four-helix bundle protein [Shinella curvata]|uniref:ClbS/DfsB family four-helix bundle protein n=1 Tax=Shinella curvata TaxID=1817964 RepID=A0ABT8XGW0_9HYPH|nr:ClbS/DfsB family four-helix bundle protein [Shinella curvata]MCJ8053283.1 ClbS/DfsB family four-helix bundle protein [Shinella curvata]MDO6122614.1 ClbS/DfsB family four-helix bundle protein [Shinella curvata]
MAVPQNKDELLAAIALESGKLLKALDDVAPDRVQMRTMEGHAKGTLMSPCDLVAYLTGWNELVLKWLERDAAGEPIDFPETGFQWNELGKLAQKFYRDYADVPYPALVARLEAAKGRIVEAIGRHDDAALYGRPWYGKWTMGRMIQFNTSSPYANARGRLRKWLKSQGSA